MIEVIKITLENEMDLVLAHKKSMRIAEKVGLTLSTQTTFATAVSEIARTVIEHTDNGVLNLGLEQNKQRFILIASVTYELGIQFTNNDAGFFYAQKLVPEFIQVREEHQNKIDMKIGIPRSLKLDPGKILLLKKYFETEEPLNAYDEIKQRNSTLNKLAEVKEKELRESRIIDEKKTEFISIASHEIKTPITVIKAYTQIAKGLKDKSGEQLTTLLSKIDLQTNKLLSLVQQLLDVSKMEHGNLEYLREEIELNTFIAEMIGILQHIYPDHKLTADLCSSVPVSIDKIRLEQVFSNLIGNAAKYSGKGTEVYIKCALDGQDKVRVSVMDQGIGMSAKTTESVFNKFYRDKDVVHTHSGIGMGLYVASKIVTDHGGEIWVESKEGLGSTFIFTIPLSK